MTLRAVVSRETHDETDRIVSNLQVTLRKDGRPRSFLAQTAAVRAALGISRDVKPWTSRANKQFRGCSVQLSQPNFLHELLDLRWVIYQQKEGVECFEKMREVEATCDLVADIRQESGRQLTGGAATLLTGSRIYSYFLDRCLIAEEHYSVLGWGFDIQIESIAAADPLQRAVAACPAAPGPAAKRRRGKAPDYQNKAVELAGNAMVLPDLASICIPLTYLLTAPDVFEQDICMDDVVQLCKQLEGNAAAPGSATDGTDDAHHQQHVVLSFDPENEEQLRALSDLAQQADAALHSSFGGLDSLEFGELQSDEEFPGHFM